MKFGPVHNTPWGTREMSVADPFANRLVFVQAPAGT